MSVVDYLRDAYGDIRAGYSPERDLNGMPIEATVDLHIGQATIVLPPDVWRVAIEALNGALAEADAAVPA